MEKISVNIPKQDRMMAINNLSLAILNVSKALIVPTTVNISNCQFDCKDGVAINVNLTEMDTDIEELELIDLDDDDDEDELDSEIDICTGDCDICDDDDECLN